jgi:hypothetical protein
MEDARYVQVVPNSHSFESLENIITHATFKSEEITLDYLIAGFENTLARGLDLVYDKTKVNPPFPCYYFADIKGILHNLIEKRKCDNFNLENFLQIIESTLKNGLDLKPRFKMERQEVYERLDTERQYQDMRWTPRREKNGTPDEEKPPAEWINYMEFHLAKAKEAVYFLNDNEALAEIRKVTALGVRCMELHGCPEREIPEELYDGE